MDILNTIFLIVFAYLGGSLVWANIITKFYKKEITDFGTNNPGTANFTREFGLSGGFLVFLGDVFTGFVVFTICIYLTNNLEEFKTLLVITLPCFILLGTFFPVYFKFRGGTGLAKCIGVSCAINPLAFLILFPIILIVTLKTKAFAVVGALFIILIVFSSITKYQYNLMDLKYTYPDLQGLFAVALCGVMVLLKGMHQYKLRLY
ncbi:MAG: glycerol-3-phosphate acyltransferase [Dehalococcoidia bacterium]|nr:glycerol-3-phosphate acyltransferase [Dehalococcoidia bacterium]